MRQHGHHRQFLKLLRARFCERQSGALHGPERLHVKRGNARRDDVLAVRGGGHSPFVNHGRTSANPVDATSSARRSRQCSQRWRAVTWLLKKNQPYRQFFEQSLPMIDPLMRAVKAPT